jgi:hypothetical protein
MPATFPPLGCDQPPSCANAVNALNRARSDLAAACSSINQLTLQITLLRIRIGSLLQLISAQTGLVGALTSTAAGLMGQFVALMAAGFVFAGIAIALGIACAGSYGLTCGAAVGAAAAAAGLFYQATQVKSQLDQVNSQLSAATSKLNDLNSQLDALNSQLQALQTQLQNAQSQIAAAQQAFQAQLTNILDNCSATCVANLAPTGLLQLPTCSMVQVS